MRGTLYLPQLGKQGTLIEKGNTMAHVRPIRLGLVMAGILLMGIGVPAATSTPARAAIAKEWLIQATGVHGTAFQRAVTSGTYTAPSGTKEGTASFYLPTSTVPKSLTQTTTSSQLRNYLVVVVGSSTSGSIPYRVEQLDDALITSVKYETNSSGQSVEYITFDFKTVTVASCTATATGATTATCRLPASKFAVAAAPSKPAVNTPVSLRLVARDIVNQRVGTYGGTVHFTASSTMTLPGNYTFTSTDAGAHLFKGLKMPIVGTYRVTARDRTSGLPSGRIVLTAY